MNSGSRANACTSWSRSSPTAANLIIYAPHLHEVSITHGPLIERIGYHCRDYFLKQWDKFKLEPWGILAHSTHVHGIGTFDAATGIEQGRVKVTLATGLSEEVCHELTSVTAIGRSIKKEDFADKEDQGHLLRAESRASGCIT